MYFFNRSPYIINIKKAHFSNLKEESHVVEFKIFKIYCEFFKKVTKNIVCVILLFE